MDPVEVRRLYRDIKIPTKLLIRQPDEKKSKKKKAKAAATAAATENGSGPDSPSINGRTMEAEVKQYFWAIFIIFLYNYSLLWVPHSAVFKFGGLLRLLNTNLIKQDKLTP